MEQEQLHLSVVKVFIQNFIQDNQEFFDFDFKDYGQHLDKIKTVLLECEEEFYAEQIDRLVQEGES